MGSQNATAPLPLDDVPMPPHTVLLSQVMRELSAQPGFTDKVLAQLQNGSRAGALMTPDLLHRMRELILGKDWQALDRFPGWTMREISPAVTVVSRVAGSADATAMEYIDLGPYSLGASHTENLDLPSTLPGFTDAGLVSPMGDDVVRGDGPNPAIAAMHPESARLADVLNRLSLNGTDGAAPMHATIGGHTVSSPEQLIAALEANGHEVMVADSRYFANFGHLHYQGQDVMMPFWVNTQVLVPGTKRPLLVPVTHAEYEWSIRGPRLNADVSFYFGIDGKAEWRVMDQLDQTWVMNRHAHEYRGADAVEVTRLTGALVRAYLRQHRARPALPFGGYYALGVCQDGIAAIELKMAGAATLFPITVETKLFDDPRDAEINALLRRLPNDRTGRRPQMKRVFGSLPVAEDALATVSIPGLADDLTAVHAAWQAGTLERTGPRWRVWLERGLLALGALLGFSVAGWLHRRARRRSR